MRIRVFTSFSGYDSQLMALRDIGADYECVGWSEIDKWAIKAHDAVFPELAAEITATSRKSIGTPFRTSTCSPTRFRVPTSASPENKRASMKVQTPDHPCCGHAVSLLRPSVRNSC